MMRLMMKRKRKVIIIDYHVLLMNRERSTIVPYAKSCQNAGRSLDQV